MIQREELKSIEQSISAMTDIVKSRCTDILDGGKSMGFQEWFDFVKEIPYQLDNPKYEIIGTPEMILKGNSADCKKKAILIASWFESKKLPWRFVVSSVRKNKRPHHVFCQYQDTAGKWINADATYSKYRIGQIKRVTMGRAF